MMKMRMVKLSIATSPPSNSPSPLPHGKKGFLDLHKFSHLPQMAT